MEYIDIEKDLIPYTFTISLAKELFEFRIDYNSTADMFTVSVSRNGVELCAGEPIIYGQVLFGDLVNRGNFPKVTIVPIDESGECNAVTFDNLSRTVFLQIVDGELYE